MIDALKKTLMAGVGATVVTAEKVESALDDLVKRGKLTADEARETIRKVADDSKAEFNEAKSGMSNLFNEMLSKANVATKKDMAAIEARLAAIEAKLSDDKS